MEKAINRAETDPIIRSDESILRDLEAAVWKQETIRSIDLDSISAIVQGGRVLWEGHVAREQNKALIEAVTRSVPGVEAVCIRLVADRELTLEVAQALSKDERTRPYFLRVGSYHGWISLSGEVPTAEIQLAAEEVAGGVASARGVVSLPRVSGKSTRPQPTAIQPRIGASVYGEDSYAGSVTRVVIHPRSRLVSHMIVDARYEVEGWPVSGEHLLPVEAVATLTRESVFLEREGAPLGGYPAFDPAEYPPAPAAWRPPYPYHPGEVLWPLAEAPEVERRKVRRLSTRMTRSSLKALRGVPDRAR